VLLGAAWTAAAADAVPIAVQTEAAIPQLSLAPVGLRADDLALIVNDADAASVEVGRYYANRRGIPDSRVVHVSFPPGQVTMSASDFARVWSELKAKVPAEVQAYALAWTLPYRVECMSVTSAFAFGFDRAYCAEGCQPTQPSTYFDSPSNAPFKDHALRPAMLLAGKNIASVKELIDRGVRSDNRWPAGSGYLLSTSDSKRNVRAASHKLVQHKVGAAYAIRYLFTDAIVGKPDVMFYFTGVQHVSGIHTNRFVDGAIADHLTSLGGMLTDSPQTSAMAWLAAGATGSYGTTVEPCNYREKFPEISVVMGRYLGGETLIEAYWKSVRMPGQGVFIGEPLARPFGGVRVFRVKGTLHAQTRLLRPGTYVLQESSGPVGPFKSIGSFDVPSYSVREFQVPEVGTSFYRVLAVPTAPKN
jgi:uncharacterized protein (TIGR03790 family)